MKNFNSASDVPDVEIRRRNMEQFKKEISSIMSKFNQSELPSDFDEMSDIEKQKIINLHITLDDDVIRLERIFRNLDIMIDVDEFLDKCSNFSSEETLTELHSYLESTGYFHVDIISPDVAMEFLRRHDKYLTRSLNIAIENGYDIKDVNSKILATLLASKMRESNFNEKSELILQTIKKIKSKI